MKRLLWLLLVSLMLPAPLAGAQQVKLRASMQGPITHPYFGVSTTRLKEEVERESKGTLSIDIYDKGKLATDAQVVDAVSSGAVDIAIAASHLFANRVPAVSILDQPFLFNFASLVYGAGSSDSEMRRLLDEAIQAKLGVRVLWWEWLGDTVFYSKGGDVAELGRFKDQRVAVLGKTLEEFVVRCGGRPVPAIMDQVHDAIKDRSVDLISLAPGALIPYGLWQVSDTITYTAHSPVVFFVVINEKAWQSLSSGHRAIMADAVRKVEREAHGRALELDAKTHAFAVGKGMRFQDLTPDQVSEWRACSAQLLDQYMERNGELARRLMDAYGRLRTEACCSASPSTAAFTRR